MVTDVWRDKRHPVNGLLFYLHRIRYEVDLRFVRKSYIHSLPWLIVYQLPLVATASSIHCYKDIPGL